MAHAASHRLPSRLLFLVLLAALAQPILGQTSASHRVHLGIQPITVMAVSGNPMPLTLFRSSGDPKSQTQDASTFYDLTTNVADVYIEAFLDLPMPPGTQLQLRAESSIGQSLGPVTLKASSRGQRIVSSMVRGLENGRRLEYSFVASKNVGDVPAQTRLVTLSLVNPDTGYRQELTQVVTFGTQSLMADATN